MCFHVGSKISHSTVCSSTSFIFAMVSICRGVVFGIVRFRYCIFLFMYSTRSHILNIFFCNNNRGSAKNIIRCEFFECGAEPEVQYFDRTRCFLTDRLSLPNLVIIVFFSQLTQSKLPQLFTSLIRFLPILFFFPFLIFFRIFCVIYYA